MNSSKVTVRNCPPKTYQKTQTPTYLKNVYMLAPLPKCSLKATSSRKDWPFKTSSAPPSHIPSNLSNNSSNILKRVKTSILPSFLLCFSLTTDTNSSKSNRFMSKKWASENPWKGESALSFKTMISMDIWVFKALSTFTFQSTETTFLMNPWKNLEKSSKT